MDVKVLYLDTDDEITTAAARIRATEGGRVAIVLPYGSRVATSRINFRLLARDATLNGKRLAIVAGDAATRALAASAGLPVFANVAEYESAQVDDGPSDEALARESTPADPEGASAVAASAAPIEEPSAEPRPVRATRTARGGRRATRTDDSGAALRDGATVSAGGLAGAALGSAAAGTLPMPASTASVDPAATTAVPIASHAGRAPSAIPAARVLADSPPDTAISPPFGAPSRVAAREGRFPPAGVRTPLAIGAAVLALALVVGGVGAYVFLPTATAVITPRETAIGPVSLRVVADPTATAPDPAAKVVPAETLTVDVEATGTFEVTGKRVEEVEAKGSVRFRNFDSDEANTIPRGSIVSTRSGVRFRTDKAITIPRAEQVLFQVFPASATVTVTAVEGGPDGNVGRNQIRVIPRGEDPQTVDVTNIEATAGGKRDEFPRVVEKDIEAATASLGEQLTAKFTERLADPTLPGDTLTVFPETAVLGDPVYATDPATLLDQEVESFELTATASGTVLAVDESAVGAVAEANIESQVEDGYALVEGSSQVEPSPGEVQDGVITFPALITARQFLVVDPAAIEAEIRGKPLADARAILDGYGQVELSVWPDWVGTIPTLDARVDVRTTAPAGP
jgi:hypothetical protein